MEPPICPAVAATPLMSGACRAGTALVRWPISAVKLTPSPSPPQAKKMPSRATESPCANCAALMAR